MLVNCEGAALQSGVVPPGDAVPPGVAGLVAVFGAPVANVLDPPPQAPSSAAATPAKSSAPVERMVEATSDGIGFPLSVR
jgi:hypothetical protein